MRLQPLSWLKGWYRNMKRILVIDGQGGKVGKLLIEEIKKMTPNAEIVAVGTNSTATENMLKACPECAATGENAVIVACRTASCIVGPLGIAIADSLFGEVTPDMAKAVGQANAEKILIPMNRCSIQVVGTAKAGVGELARLAAERAAALFND